MGFFVKVLIAVSLLFPVVAVLSFIRSKRQKRPGKELLTVRTAGSLDTITISKSFPANMGKKWCRVKAVFTFIPTGKLPASNGHPYTLRLTDENNRVVFSEQRCLSDFLGFCWHPEASKGKSGRTIPICDTVLLEFVPPWPGIYHIFFSLKTAEPFSTIQSLRLEVREDVWPLRKKPYVHTCIDLRKATFTPGDTA